MDKDLTAFISYSWDGEEQKDWVTNLVNLLRHNGIVAKHDVFEIQKGTVNLNAMMVNKLRDSDYSIVVLTEKYAEKADTLQGGVGFETTLLISYVQENLQKIIPIMTKWNVTRAIPFYLKGVHYIDFSDHSRFEEKFKELLHRMYKVDLLEEVPIGKRPVLSPRKTGDVAENRTFDLDNLIPDFRKITDIDKNRFMMESFKAINSGLSQLLGSTKQKNGNFDFYMEDITNRKTIYKIYINGNQKYAIKIWLGSNLGSVTETINVAYGKHITENDTSMNEIIACEVGNDKNLLLKMTMNMFDDKTANTPMLIVGELWKNILMWLK
jgi:hypothetical protein